MFEWHVTCQKIIPSSFDMTSLTEKKLIVVLA